MDSFKFSFGSKGALFGGLRSPARPLDIKGLAVVNHSVYSRRCGNGVKEDLVPFGIG